MTSMKIVGHAAAILLLLSAAPASAQLGDTIKLNFGYTRQSDSNLFRLPANANTIALIGRDSAAEEIGVSSVGIGLNKPYGLQRVELNIGAVNYQYQNFDYLNFSALNYNAALRWSLTPRLHGNLTTSRNETLNSFADTSGNTQRNLRTDINTRLDADLEFGGPWSLRSGATQTTQTNERLILALSEYRATSVDIGLRYRLSSGSSLTYAATSTEAKTLNRALSATNLFDDGYTEIDHQVGAHWTVSGTSTADLNATYINRTFPNFSQRDFSGVNASASLSWTITGKTALNASLSRETSSYQTATTNSVQTDRLSIAPVWQISPKAMLRFRIDLAQRDYPDLAAGLGIAARRDNTQDTSLSLDWQIYQYVTLSTTLQNSRRVVNQPGLDFDSTLASISAQFSY